MLLDSISMERQVSKHRIGSVIMLGIDLILMILVPDLLVTLFDITEPIAFRIVLVTILYAINTWWIKLSDKKFMNRYNDMLEQQALLLGTDVDHGTITSEYSYHTMKKLVLEYEKQHDHCGG